jgi:outer membrane protein OmpA-like peptidoglycan-associated protein
MKNIKSYNQFLEDSKLNEEEGLKDWATGIALGASVLNPFATKAVEAPAKQDVGVETEYQAPADKTEDDKTFKWGDKKKKTLHRDVKSGSEASKERQAANLQKQGWTLDSVSVDTLWKHVVVAAPDTIVTSHDFKFDVDGDQFLTGKFQLNTETAEGIKAAVAQIKAEKGLVTDFIIESSTDREPIQMSYGSLKGNAALAQRRADAVSEQLVGLGIDPSIVYKTIKPDQGPDLYSGQISYSQRTKARSETAQYRYVTISIVYLKSDVVTIPGVTKDIPNIKKIYHLSKEVETGTVKIKRKHFKERKVHSPIKHTKRGKNSAVKCETFGNKDAWWNNLGW